MIKESFLCLSEFNSSRSGEYVLPHSSTLEAPFESSSKASSRSSASLSTSNLTLKRCVSSCYLSADLPCGSRTSRRSPRLPKRSSRAADARSSATACADGPSAMSMSQRMDTTCLNAPGATGQQHARSSAERAAANTTERAHTDAGPRTTALRKTGILTTTEQLWLSGRRPHGTPFIFQRLSCQLRYAPYGCFAKARPARPTSTCLRSHQLRRTLSSGSIIAQTKNTRCHALCCKGRLEESCCRHSNAPHPRATRAVMNG